MPLTWNVKHAETVSQAVSAMRHSTPDCSVSPSSDIKTQSFGRTLELRRKLNNALDQLKALACDSYYQAHGMADYEAKCAELFEIKPRRGYVQLTMKEVQS